MPHARGRRGWITLRYAVDLYPASWLIEDEEKVPESRRHHLRGNRLEGLFLGWKRRTRRDVQVGRHLALRWDEEHPQVGVDPDVYVVEPPPPEGDDVTSLRTWETGHHPPLLAVEVVSPSRPDKDYGSSPLKYAASGTQELWVFDPALAGPRTQGGPFRIQVWRRDEEGGFERVYAGEGPVFSQAIGAWVFVVDEGQSLAIADDEAGTLWWLTPEEMERAEKENERAEKERVQAEKERVQAEKERVQAEKERVQAEKERVQTEKDEALRRVAELEALLAAKKASSS
jgi:Uma2 family endonuclease